MKEIMNILHTLLLIYVVKADWNDYKAEVNNLKFLNSSTFKKFMQRNISAAEVQPKVYFPCNVYQVKEKATSVHKLRPTDIGVIGAMGDSITAGNGILAKTVIGSLVQFRGYSWDVGGESTYEDNSRTIPNILKFYNPELTGYSIGTGDQSSPVARCNVAAPGNVAKNLPGQAKLLIERLQTLGGSSFQNDWKMITIFIGGNDLCRSCKDKDMFNPQQYTKYISEALDLLLDHVPKAFINLVGLMDLSALRDLHGGIVCNILHSKVCSCAIKETTRPLVQEMASEYTMHLERLVASGRYDTREDFTVVLQPFLKDADIPRADGGLGDLSFFAYDCFHFNQKGDNAMAAALWRSMFEPVGNKSTEISYSADLYCPQENEFFATAKNSPLLRKGHYLEAGEPEVSPSLRSPTKHHVEASDVTMGGKRHIFGFFIATILCVVLLGYGSFFVFHWSMNRMQRRREQQSLGQRRGLLSGNNPCQTYQSI